MTTTTKPALRAQLQRRWEKFAKLREKAMAEAKRHHDAMLAAAKELDAFDRANPPGPLAPVKPWHFHGLPNASQQRRLHRATMIRAYNACNYQKNREKILEKRRRKRFLAHYEAASKPRQAPS